MSTKSVIGSMTFLWLVRVRFKLVLDVIDLCCQRTVTGQVKPRRYRKPQLFVPISLLEGVESASYGKLGYILSAHI